MTTDTSNLVVFGTKPKDSIYIPQSPFGVRNDCSVGQWKIGDEDFRGNSIDISIIKASQFFGSLGKTKNTSWLQLWFIPAPSEEKLPVNTVCLTYLKTRSISQFSQKITELMAAGEPARGIFTASFEKHSGELGTYYSVKWDWRDRTSEAESKQLKQIASFMRASPRLIDMSTNLICIDGRTPEEIELLISSTRAEVRSETNGKPAKK